MIDDQARAIAIVGALLAGASGSAGFVGGRMTAPAPPAEVRFVHVPPPAPLAPSAGASPGEPLPIPPEALSPVPLIKPPAAPPVEAIPTPQPRPKVESKPKPQPKPEPAARKPRAPVKRGLPSCAVVEREYQAMTWPQRMSAYQKATPEEIAHGKRCLGFW